MFLDELPEFRKNVLEVLRQLVEAGYTTISRAKVSVTYPASIILVAAMNHYTCGYATDPRIDCSCIPTVIQRYMIRISGPLLEVPILINLVNVAPKFRKRYFFMVNTAAW